MAISGGFRVHDEGTMPRYRVPDLLTKEEFLAYMAANYGVGVDFRDLTSDEKKKLDAGERIVAPTPSEPIRQDAEIVQLRKMLGLEKLEEMLKVKRSVDPSDMDPIVELDSRVLSHEDFVKKYGESKPAPKKAS